MRSQPEPDGQSGYRKNRSAIALEPSLPDEALNTIACRAREGKGRPLVIETVPIRQADLATFDPLITLEKNTMIR